MKSLLIVFFFLFSLSNTQSQPLFTYGKDKVDKDEFLWAFKKNNNNSINEASLREYLNLYIHFKLKAKAARDAGLDSLANQVQELKNFRTQIENTFTAGEDYASALIKEATERSKTDIEISQIYIPFETNGDTLQAWKTIQIVLKKLKAGNDFATLSTQYSGLPIVKKAKGYIGFITTFTLPYSIENIIYGLKTGHYSGVYKGKNGYHIFKKISQRSSAGILQVAQILFAFTEGMSEPEKKLVKALADEVYKKIKSGESFEEMVTKYSQDKFSSSNKGELPEFSIGKYDPNFEKAAFNLKSKGDISEPALTENGYHILKLIAKKSLTDTATANDYAFYIKRQVLQSDRMQTVKQIQNQKILSLVGYKNLLTEKPKLFTLTDSMMKASDFDKFLKENKNFPIHSFAKQTIYANDWMQYVKALSERSAKGSPFKPNYEALMKNYINVTALEYYKAHLEEYNKLFKYQIEEFADGNLLFEIMERNVWGKASQDNEALINYYNSNKEKFKWEASADAFIVSAADSATAEIVKSRIEKNPFDWKKLNEEFNGKMIIDSGRFELAQIPVLSKTIFKSNTFTAPVKNEIDGTIVFSYINKVYPANEQRSFEDARGMVINLYQTVLEEQWINLLKKKYPVAINEVVFKQLIQK